MRLETLFGFDRFVGLTFLQDRDLISCACDCSVLFGPVDQNSTYFPVPASKDSTDETKFTVRPRELGEGNAPDWLRSKATRHFVSVMTDAESATTYRQTHKDCHLYKLKPEYEVSAPLFPFEHRNGGHWTIQDKIKFLSYWVTATSE